jgi:hypothetical protein
MFFSGFPYAFTYVAAFNLTLLEQKLVELHLPLALTLN